MTLSDRSRFGFVVAQVITGTRVVATIGFVVIALGGDTSYLGFGVYLWAVVSDFFDGAVARGFRCVTMVGGAFDLFADKFLTVASLSYGVAAGAPPVPCLLIIGRELAVMIVRSRLFPENWLPAKRWIGVLGVAPIRVSIGLLLLMHSPMASVIPELVISVLLWIAALNSVGILSVRLVRSYHNTDLRRLQ